MRYIKSFPNSRMSAGGISEKGLDLVMSKIKKRIFLPIGIILGIIFVLIFICEKRNWNYRNMISHMDEYVIKNIDLDKELDFDLYLINDEEQNKTLYEDDNGIINFYKSREEEGQWVVYFDFIGKSKKNFTIINLETCDSKTQTQIYTGNVVISYMIGNDEYIHMQHWNEKQAFSDRVRFGYQIFQSTEEQKKIRNEKQIKVYFKINGLKVQKWREKHE